MVQDQNVKNRNLLLRFLYSLDKKQHESNTQKHFNQVSFTILQAAGKSWSSKGIFDLNKNNDKTSMLILQKNSSINRILITQMPKRKKKAKKLVK